MQQHLVIDIVQAWASWYLNHGNPAGFQNTIDLLNCSFVVLDMLQHIQQDNHIYTLLWQWAGCQIKLQERNVWYLCGKLLKRFPYIICTDQESLGETLV